METGHNLELIYEYICFTGKINTFKSEQKSQN